MRLKNYLHSNIFNILEYLKRIIDNIIEIIMKYIDMRDIAIFVGLVIMSTGLWLLYPWLSLTFAGGFILYQALISGSRK